MTGPVHAVPTFVTQVLLDLYIALWVILAAYGLHRLHLIRLSRRACPLHAPDPPQDWPSVTVQLPVYNELYVAERLLLAAAAIEYPRDRLEIQVLDDSVDETTAIIARKTEELRAQGVDVVHLRRGSREGFKAGALQYGLAKARGELLAIFDADFVPPPGILRELVPHFSEPRVGLVQSRWEHLNADYSALARAQALSLDGHFVIEHAARMRAGRFFNFNGTAGVFRRSCIEETGGWQADTLTEDLDLSYRAQLLGWRFVFVPHVACPSELPVEMNAFKAQQYRWVKGSVQVARKLLPLIWRAPIPLPVKLEASIHLTYNLGYVVLLLLAFLLYPVVLVRYESRSLAGVLADTVLYLISTCSVLFYFAYAQRQIRPDWKRRIRDLPFAMSLAIGLAVNNTRAVVEAFAGHPSPFLRTPKFQIERRGDGWRGKRYRAPVSAWALLELLLGLYFAWAVLGLARAGHYAAIPFFLLYLFGFLYVGGLSILHATAPRGAADRGRRRRTAGTTQAAARPPYSTQGTHAGSRQAPVAANAGRVA
ncbi:MAG TPA: glycosyltransferase [Candidatus Eisenbacteria bacterium]